MDTSLNYSEIAHRLKAAAAAEGFEACGIATATAVDAATRHHLTQWLATGQHAQMGYMANHFEKRCDPRLLVEGCRSLIVVALNYYPAQRLPSHHPQIACYAYGDDYHLVMQEKLAQLWAEIAPLAPTATARCFCDTAPILERYWAVQAGVGFIGMNRQLILPHKGSHYFLGVIATTLPLPADTPIDTPCAQCGRCIAACPTHALHPTHGVDARRCLSYHTIENRGEIPPDIAQQLGNRLYGCDTCQEVCPHNRAATPTHEPRLALRPALLSLDLEAVEQLTPTQFSTLFRHSAIKRTKHAGLLRNAAWLRRLGRIK